MLRSDTLMLDNKLFPLYQERVTCPTFTTEHNNEQFCCGDDDDEEHCKSLVMLGVGNGAGKQENIHKSTILFYFCSVCCVGNYSGNNPEVFLNILICK